MAIFFLLGLFFVLFAPFLNTPKSGLFSGFFQGFFRAFFGLFSGFFLIRRGVSFGGEVFGFIWGNCWAEIKIDHEKWADAFALQEDFSSLLKAGRTRAVPNGVQISLKITL